MRVDASLSGIVEQGHAAAGSLKDFPSVWSVGVEDRCALVVEIWVRTWEDELSVGAIGANWSLASAICWWFRAVDDWAIIQVNAATISKEYFFFYRSHSPSISQNAYTRQTWLPRLLMRTMISFHWGIGFAETATRARSRTAIVLISILLFRCSPKNWLKERWECEAFIDRNGICRKLF